MARMELRIDADQRSNRRVFSEADWRVQKTRENKQKRNNINT